MGELKPRNATYVYTIQTPHFLILDTEEAPGFTREIGRIAQSNTVFLLTVSTEVM